MAGNAVDTYTVTVVQSYSHNTLDNHIDETFIAFHKKVQSNNVK